jgi:hypothetical protein
VLHHQKDHAACKKFGRVAMMLIIQMWMRFRDEEVEAVLGLKEEAYPDRSVLMSCRTMHDLDDEADELKLAKAKRKREEGNLL